ncbi:MAG: OmpH family outer membrane protein [Flavobacteriales bacterium]
MALSAVLAVCVIFLWVKMAGLQSGSAAVSDEVPAAPAFSGDGGPRPTVVAFINGDSLNANYDFIVEKSKDLDQKMSSAEERVKKEYGPRQAQYEQNMRYAQEHPDMSEAEAIALQKDMERLQMEMDEIQQREVGSLQKKEAQLQDDLIKRVNEYLAKYTKERGIDYVINKQSEFQVLLYGNADYDITAEVIAGLNAEYAAEKGAK